MIDPRTWKREHKIALLCAVGLGATFGAIIGLRDTRPWRRVLHEDFWGWLDLWHVRAGFGHNSCGGPWPWCLAVDLTYWFLACVWIIFGGAVGGLIVYIRQLLRE